jgi:hypothetical protein
MQTPRYLHQAHNQCGRGANRHDGGNDCQRGDDELVRFHPVFMPAADHVTTYLSGTPRMGEADPVRGQLMSTWGNCPTLRVSDTPQSMVGRSLPPRPSA